MGTRSPDPMTPSEKQSPPTPTHPLEPLSAEEIDAAASLLRADERLSAAIKFVSVELHEPAKDRVLAGAAAGRRAAAIVYDPERRQICEAVLCLEREEVERLEFVEGAVPPVLLDELEAVQRCVREDERWQEAMRKRGIEDLDTVLIEPWPVGGYGWRTDRRLLVAYSFARPRLGDNPYARPVEGVIVRIELDPTEVVDVEDHGVVPLPPLDGNYAPDRIAAPNRPSYEFPRDDMRPIEILQPEGPSFEVDGHHVRWQRWSLRLGFTAREGLILHQVSYDDRGHERPVLYRASLAEMIVPYGDPGPGHYRRNVFDMGEAGLGRLANSLTLGCDCLGEIRYFDGWLAGGDGKPIVIPNAICMHEEDSGIAWKHTDVTTGEVEVRRMRRLVISFISTVDNYEYGFYWHLYQDGTIELEVKLTGIILTGALEAEGPAEFGEVVAPGLYGPNHQHHLCVRLDTCVDGSSNCVEEVDSVLDERGGADDRYGSAWRTTRTLLASEQRAQRPVSNATARYWRVINRSPSGGEGQTAPTGYRLEPGEAAPLLQRPESPNGRRALFATKNLWVTRYRAGERFAAGDYPNQHAGGAGLPEYAAGDEPLEDCDLVVWYSFGAHHVVRPEDWPVMPVSRIGFKLRPDGFFDGNPALDLPPNEACAHAGSA